MTSLNKEIDTHKVLMLVAFILLFIFAVTAYYMLKKNEQWNNTYYKDIKIALESEKDSLKRKELIEKFKK